jgi:crotonobetainyl-CoA:carnitine CoA-transferase CaiB-like acyl-CoA transferase
MSEPAQALALAGTRVVEYTHRVMGPTFGMILADLGAEVIKVELGRVVRARDRGPVRVS